jgi:hypothetical protein
MKGLAMKPYATVTLIAMILTLAGCATSSNVPSDAQKIGLYIGTFAGTEYAGRCRVTLYELPDGSGMFTGAFTYEPKDQNMLSKQFSADAENELAGFKGQMQGLNLTGTFTGNVAGTISGTLSDERSQLEGSYSIKAPGRLEGIWQAAKK